MDALFDTGGGSLASLTGDTPQLENLSLPDAFDSNLPYVTADYGCRLWSVYGGTFQIKDMKASDFARLDFMGDHKQLVAEYAHLQVPRTERSRAQVYTDEERGRLLDRASEMGVSIYCFPNACRPTYNDKKKEGKPGEDMDDAKCMYEYLGEDYCRIVMQKLRRNYNRRSEGASQAIYEFRDRTNSILNWARTYQYDTESDQFFCFDGKEDHIKRVIEASIEPPVGRGEGFNQAYKDVTGRSDPNDVRWVVCYTLASMFIEPDGGIRTHPTTGEPPGLNWLERNIVGNTPYHHRGGIARSNVQWWGMRSYVKRLVGKGESIAKLREQYGSEVADVRRHYRSALKYFMRQLSEGSRVYLEREAEKIANLKRASQLQEPVNVKCEQLGLFEQLNKDNRQ